MKLIYLPLLAVQKIGFLQPLLFGFIPVYVSVKILHFYQVLERNYAKQKSYGKSFKIVLSLAYDRMPTKSELTNLGRISYLINDLNSVNPLFYFSYYIKQLLNVYNLRFPKISQHPACMDHAILHGKPFSNPLLISLTMVIYPVYCSGIFALNCRECLQ